MSHYQRIMNTKEHAADSNITDNFLSKKERKNGERKKKKERQRKGVG